jgi:hypothetical protein
MKNEQFNIGDLVEVTYMHPNEHLIGAIGLVETELHDHPPGFSVYRVLINETRHPMISLYITKFIARRKAHE